MDVTKKYTAHIVVDSIEFSFLFFFNDKNNIRDAKPKNVHFRADDKKKTS